MLGISLVDTPDGRRIEVARDVVAPAERAWALLTETRHWPAWGPPVTDVDPADATIETDFTGHVQAFWLFWVPFTVTACANRRWTWTAMGLTPPADGHRVDDLGDGRCRMALELPLWAPWYVPLCLVALWNLERLATGEGTD